MDMDLSDKISTALNGVLDMQADSGPGLDSILPTSNIKCKTKRMKATLTVFSSGSAKHLHSQEANDTTIFYKTKWVTT
jgi:hypothetical protein